MDFCEKLQQLRRQKGLTQEDVAKALFVSRTAVSKWESGRGYPNIDSLKAIAALFEITVDELLSGEELLTLATENNKQNKRQLCDLVFGLLDIGAALFLFLPCFRKATSAVSLLSLDTWLKPVYLTVVLILIGWGVLTLALQRCERSLWLRCKSILSLLFGACGALLFILSSQPYAATVLFLFLITKAVLLAKKQ